MRARGSEIMNLIEYTNGLAYTAETHKKIVYSFLALPYSTRRNILMGLGVWENYFAGGINDVEKYGAVFDRIIRENKRTQFLIAVLSNEQ